MCYKRTVKSFPIPLFGSGRVQFIVVMYFFWMFSICSRVPVCKACGYGSQAVPPCMDACIIVVLISSWVAASICPRGLMYLLCILQTREVVLKELKWLIEGRTTSEGQNHGLIQSDLADARGQFFLELCAVFGWPWHGWLGKEGTGLGCVLCLLTILYDSWKVCGKL